MNMEKKQFTKEMRELCRKEFPTKAYKQHPTKTYLTTLKAMYVTERLNDVFGVGRWTIHIEIIERTNDYVLIQGEFESRDYDVCVPKQFGGHQTTGKGTEPADGFKSALTDCISKIASYFEIGIEMFKGNIIVGNTQTKTSTQPTTPSKPWLNPKTKEWDNTVEKLKTGKVDLATVKKHYSISKENEKTLTDLIEEAKAQAYDIKTNKQ